MIVAARNEKVATIADSLKRNLPPPEIAELVGLLRADEPPKRDAVKAEGKPLSETEKCETLYRAYPRRIGKAEAMKAIAKALKKATYIDLLEAVMEFAASPAGQQGEFTPHPATWFNREQWNDDREEWRRERDRGTGKASRGVGRGERFDPNAGPVQF
jgi:hypothetical protein